MLYVLYRTYWNFTKEGNRKSSSVKGTGRLRTLQKESLVLNVTREGRVAYGRGKDLWNHAVWRVNGARMGGKPGALRATGHLVGELSRSQGLIPGPNRTALRFVSVVIAHPTQATTSAWAEAQTCSCSHKGHFSQLCHLIT